MCTTDLGSPSALELPVRPEPVGKPGPNGAAGAPAHEDAPAAKAVKCVVWDLDHTLWDGVLAEGDAVQLKPGAAEVLRALDARGILNSVCSRNSAEDALRRLRALGVEEYFLYPQIGWGAKSEAIARLQRELNIGLDTLLFIDDQPFERDEVRAAHPQVLCVPAEDYLALPEHPRVRAAAVTEDAARRRLMYREDMHRKRDEESFEGPPAAFLASLDMVFTIVRAQEEDLLRAQELTLRTNQLNSTGVTYGIEELRALMHSPRHSLLVCELQDRYGSYGRIGLALVEHFDAHDHVRLLLMSCRTASRGVGGVLLAHLMRRAAAAGKGLRADFRRTERNRQMLVTYQFAGFREVERGADGRAVLAHELRELPEVPAWIRVVAPG